MKNLTLILFLILLISCANKKNVVGVYTLNKEKNNSFNIILKVDKNNRFKFESFSTGSNGITEGNWIQNGKVIKLMPDKADVKYDTLDGRIVGVEAYRPLSDTAAYKIHGRKLIQIRDKKYSYIQTLFRIK